MSSQKTAIIILNKSSGLNNPARDIITSEKLIDWFAAGGIRAAVVACEPEDLVASTETALAGQPDMIIAAGGDGTVSSIAAVTCHSDIPLGVLPLGTLNHFAQDLGMPVDIAACVAILCNGAVYQVDIGQLNDQYFINNASIGFYPKMVRHRDQQIRDVQRNKWFALTISAVRMLLHFPLLTVSIETEQGSTVTKTPLVFIGNNRYDCSLAAGRACLSEGELCVYVVKCSSRFAVLRLLWQAMYRGFYAADDFVAYHVNEAVIRVKAKAVQTASDGEVHLMSSPLRYRSMARALRILGPRR